LIDTGSFGGDLDDLIYGGDGNEWIEGHQGNDTLSGNGGHDILIGGVGNDSLVGGHGHDVYVVSSGDGADILHDNDSAPGNVDEVRFLDVSSTDVRGVQRVGNSLLLSYGSSDQLTVQYYFTSAAYRIEQFRFDDGVMWGLADVEQRMLSGAALT
jgi:Ca2+-binding RTX toxin-like protein